MGKKLKFFLTIFLVINLIFFIPSVKTFLRALEHYHTKVFAYKLVYDMYSHHIFTAECEVSKEYNKEEKIKCLLQ